jgi:hypothetical protein
MLLFAPNLKRKNILNIMHKKTVNTPSVRVVFAPMIRAVFSIVFATSTSRRRLYIPRV